ncbi:hypothetical protein BVC93_18070 [Mycobacterium sp. MS1601]|uniref:RES family NAD+ phosphorylase n=1 Tax=Mycobacterium sp. MS1601 TaxID=1936029 RepID=UPI0009796FF6|nr:RES family NAD+ phosphorylase [Mycobacterium sp. MS1601]AQA04016.1 hypothetical protein BVC93_18070 [Mycobacterium sp. MS1601]
MALSKGEAAQWVHAADLGSPPASRAAANRMSPAGISIFDAASRLQYCGLRFLQQFVSDVTLPVELDGREHIDYVATQVFTEYVRYAFPTHVDGLMFPSTQGGGNNVVVFVGPDACANARI